MRSILAAILAALTLCALSACGAQEQPETPAPEDPAPVQEPVETPPAPTAEELAAQVVEDLLSSMTLEEKVGQVFFVRCPAENAVEDVSTYHLGGYILFGRDVRDSAGNWLTKEQFTKTIQSYQAAAKSDTGIPLLIGADEEGGTVRRLSANPNLVPAKWFKSPQWMWDNQYFEGNIFSEYTWEGSGFLLECGLNVNLAPVCDVATDPNAFIYDRTLGQDAETTAEFVRSTVDAMTGSGLGSVLKHFPGYGSNTDTHTGIALDDRPYEDFVNGDFLPFLSGMAAGGDKTAVLVSHNIVECMDPDLPASLSPAVHDILRSDLSFDGVVMTDDLAMEAVNAYAQDDAVAVMALQAGNDLVLTTDYRAQIPKVLEAVENGTLEEDVIDTACRRVLRWKQALGLLPTEPDA